jgi:C4-dicarboxylate-specific signal transduction histidine kinase
MARQTGDIRLRETEMLSRLVEKHKRTEEELIKTNKELSDTHIQLIQTARLASLGELSAGVAHELNQPLMVIRSLSQVMLRNFGELSPEQIQGQLTVIERNTKRMMNIINHLRMFSRQTPSEMSAADVNRIIEDAFLMIGEQLRLRNIRVEKNFEPDIPPCYGNPNQLEQVFLNLITNAKDAIMEKMASQSDFTGKLEIITRRSSDNQKTLEILFKDNGTGVPSECRNKLFDPFFTTKEVGKGTGLGLSISYGIIKDHQGSIEIMETSPEGTSFVITLPFEMNTIQK